VQVVCVDGAMTRLATSSKCAMARRYLIGRMHRCYRLNAEARPARFL